MQFQADMIRIPLAVPEIEELSGAGAAYAAGISAGLFDWDTILGHRKTTEFRPQMPLEQRNLIYDGWKRAVSSILTVK